MNAAEDLRWMQAALALARRGLGRVWPNPAVGCVIIKDGRLVGRGWTAPGGRPHAEPQALKMAGHAAQGATAYVTLEPCAHHGQTPPCARAMIAAKVARVVIACTDPDPRVDGGGIAMLRAAGIEVTTGIAEAKARALNAGFLSRVIRGRPTVTLKLAATLDGRIATANGESQWITGPAARRHVHAQRAIHDAVMVGGGTARADDPSLTVRGLGIAHQPVRVVVSRGLDLPESNTLLRTLPTAPLWLCHGESADTGSFRTSGAKLLQCTEKAGLIDPNALLQTLGSQGLTRLYCEGGSTLAASLLRADLVDDLHLYSAGKIIGGDGLPALRDLGLADLSAAPQFSLESHRPLGTDLFQHWRINAR